MATQVMEMNKFRKFGETALNEEQKKETASLSRYENESKVVRIKPIPRKTGLYDRINSSFNTETEIDLTIESVARMLISDLQLDQIRVILITSDQGDILSWEARCEGVLAFEVTRLRDEILVERLLKKTEPELNGDAYKLPVKIHDSIIGQIQIRGGDITHGLTRENQCMLLMAADKIGLSFKCAKLENHVRGIRGETQLMLMEAIEAKDGVTYEHSKRVSEYAIAVGRKLGLSVDNLKHLKCAALLHDIGKIGISEQILNKPGPLTRNETEVIKTHTLIGRDILIPCGEFEAVARIVASHHERYDGGGYPYGFRGEKIPLEARIIAMVDAFDAMITPRPYRIPFSKDRAMIELEKNSGSQFDPDVVKVAKDILLNVAFTTEHYNSTSQIIMHVVNGTTSM